MKCLQVKRIDSKVGQVALVCELELGHRHLAHVATRIKHGLVIFYTWST